MTKLDIVLKTRGTLNLSPSKPERVPLKIPMGLHETSDLTPERDYPEIFKEGN